MNKENKLTEHELMKRLDNEFINKRNVIEKEFDDRKTSIENNINSAE